MESKQADVSIIDYGLNNLKSVSKAFEKIDKTTVIIDTPNAVLAAKSLVLPGIGAFGDGMDGLRTRGLIEPIKQQAKEGRPFLGICLGMQMLFSESEEFGINKGLDLIAGRVIPFKHPKDININNYRVPHVGWNELSGSAEQWKNTTLQDTKSESNVYFVHSFYPDVENSSEVVATTEHGGQVFCSVVKKGNVTGTQFHPEKSGTVGLKMLKAFCDLYQI